jgi:hypothetical protein
VKYVDSHPPSVEPPKIMAELSSSLAEHGYHCFEVIRTVVGLSKMSQVSVSQDMVGEEDQTSSNIREDVSKRGYPCLQL